MISPRLLTATPAKAGCDLCCCVGCCAGCGICGAFIGSMRACFVSLPTSIGIIGIYLLWPSAFSELDLRRRSTDILSTSILKFERRFSFSITGLNSDSKPPGFCTRPQHEHLEYDGTDDAKDDVSESTVSTSRSLPFLLEEGEEESESSGVER